MKFSLAMRHNGLLQKLPNTKFWVVKESFIWHIDYKTKDESFIVPEGMKTDFGSIPRPLRIFFNPTRYISYILHDYLCSIGYNRKKADLILIEALYVEGASSIEKFCIYIGVRIGAYLGIGKPKKKFTNTEK